MKIGDERSENPDMKCEVCWKKFDVSSVNEDIFRELLGQRKPITSPSSGQGAKNDQST